MRRLPFPAAALAAGLVVLLTGCAGETPTSPSSNQPPGQGGGSCTVSIAMVSTSLSPTVGSEVVVRAAVTKGGAAVPDGTSVQFTTDLGVFAENGLPTVSKTTISGNADVTLFSSSAGPAHVKAAFDCATATLTVNYSGSTTQGPYVSSFTPTSGSCAGGDTVTISGGLFGTSVGAVYFGGAPASIVSWAANKIVVGTPLRTLKNASVPEQVDLVVAVPGGSNATAGLKFTYFCVDQRMSIASLSPTAGSPGGGDIVVLLGSHFGSNIATTQVTFCGLPAQVTNVSDTQITVTTPAHTLANPALAEACPVVVTRDLGLVSMQSATSPVPFTYRGTGSTGACNTDATFYVSSFTPNTGPPDGGILVTIVGSGFPTNPALLRVEFGGNPASIIGTPTTTTFQVSLPRRVLTYPDVPETVDIVVTDLGSVSQRCARVVGGFVYTAQALIPTIYSVSPRTGPNDQATLTTIFGTGFQFPEQVFMTGGLLCGVQRVEAQVSQVSPTQIIFKTPIANGGNACLSGQLVDVVVLNPATGKTATCPSCFKYYSCPTAGTASPSVGSAIQATTVVISGNNFSEPVVANFNNGGRRSALQVTSVSNTSIIVTMPPLQTLTGGSLSCGNTDGFIDLTFPGLACAGAPVSVAFSYHTDPPTATSATPTSVSQDGTILGLPGTITVLGANFAAPMTVQLLAGGTPVGGVNPILANVSSPTALTFGAPPVPDAAFLKQACVPPGGTTLTGTSLVATVFGIRVQNSVTLCTYDLPNVLTYHPLDTTCHSALSITNPSLPTGTANVAYGPIAMLAVGGTPPYTWSAIGLPAAMSINAGTGAISGTPAAAGTSTVSITVTDAVAVTAQKTYSLVIGP